MSMKRRTALVLTAASAALICLSQRPSAADQPDVDELRARVEQLEAEVTRLRAASSDAWLDEQRADAIRALVQDVLADADSRASLLQNGATGGWDNGFYLASPDGNFKLKLMGVLQVRFVYNNQDDGSGDPHRWGFENKRTALKFGGNVVDPTWQYFVQGLFGAAGGDFMLLDAFITKDLGAGWSVRAGKFRLPFLREQIVNYTNLVPVERSLLSATFGLGRAQAVQLAWKGERIGAAVAYSDDIDGIGGITAPALAYDTEYAFTARVEGLLQGGWNQFSDFTSFRGDEFGALLGAAVHWQSSEYGTPDYETEILRWTVDASLEFGGADVYAAVIGNHTDENDPAISNVDQIAFLVQGGVFITDDWEVFARYVWADEDTDADDLSVLEIGAVHYFNKHQLKWTTDVGFGFNEVTSTFASGGAGWRADAPGDDGQIVVRSQMQLMF
jgi:hypothetical protein